MDIIANSFVRENFSNFTNLGQKITLRDFHILSFVIFVAIIPYFLNSILAPFELYLLKTLFSIIYLQKVFDKRIAHDRDQTSIRNSLPQCNIKVILFSLYYLAVILSARITHYSIWKLKN